MNETDQETRFKTLIAHWSNRVQIAEKQKQLDVVEAVFQIIRVYETLLECQSQDEEPAFLEQANTLRKKITASEQHRTMCVEHGLSDTAIDATLEIQDLEKQLVALVASHHEATTELRQ